MECDTIGLANYLEGLLDRDQALDGGRLAGAPELRFRRGRETGADAAGERDVLSPRSGPRWSGLRPATTGTPSGWRTCSERQRRQPHRPAPATREPRRRSGGRTAAGIGIGVILGVILVVVLLAIAALIVVNQVSDLNIPDPRGLGPRDDPAGAGMAAMVRTSPARSSACRSKAPYKPRSGLPKGPILPRISNWTTRQALRRARDHCPSHATGLILTPPRRSAHPVGLGRAPGGHAGSTGHFRRRVKEEGATHTPLSLPARRSHWARRRRRLLWPRSGSSPRA